MRYPSHASFVAVLLLVMIHLIPHCYTQSTTTPSTASATSVSAIPASRWEYTYPLCGTAQQSPINVVSSTVSVPTALSYLSTWVPIVATTPSHPILNVNTTSPTCLYLSMLVRNIQLTSSSFLENMVLVEIDFRTQSEHTLDGTSYPLEVQYVFASTDYATRIAAGNTQYPTVVLSVLYSSQATGLTSSPDIIIQLVTGIGQLNAAAAGTQMVSMNWTPTTLSLPTSWYIYTGSLTSPPCMPNVRWFVATKPIPARSTDITTIIGKITALNGGQMNNRPTQSLNGRVVKLTNVFSLASF